LFGSIAHIYELAGGSLLKNGLCDLGVLANFIYLFLFLAILDFFGYWFHRIQHASSTSWSLHQLHHRDECMNVATALRNHWLDTPLQVLMVALPFMLIFPTPRVTVSLYRAIPMAVEFFKHSNLKLYLGPFSPIVAGPHLHRIHHSRLQEHLNKNFARIFPVYDVLFGTYYRPARDECPKTGIEGLERVHSVMSALTNPLPLWYRRVDARYGLSRFWCRSALERARTRRSFANHAGES
jgi:sterol desaturase/sphingolipid hydroxylase (fatty acid hydroxylase superfamily)